MYYSELDLDRASGKRANPAWIAELLAAAQTRAILLWRDLCLVRGGSPVILQADHAEKVLAAADDPVLLGLDRAGAVFAADLSALDRDQALRVAGADDTVDVRRLVTTLSAADAGLLAYARGITHWNRNQRYCGACGARTDPRDGGHLRICVNCEKLHFPRIEPAVITLVELPGTPKRCLLGRHRGADPNRYSTLAGFVEIGENLEDAVRREVAEEAGVTVRAVSYQGSQAWPFPAGLMIAFRAEAVSDTIRADGEELLDACWFTVTEIRARLSGQDDPFRMDSIGKTLIESWLSDNECGGPTSTA
jgi:NAD+ diphosphatase